MEVTIGSFNVLNLKLKESDKGSFREQKIKKFAKIITDCNYSIVAMQEIQSYETAEAIAVKNHQSPCNQ